MQEAEQGVKCGRMRDGIKEDAELISTQRCDQTFRQMVMLIYSVFLLSA